MSDYGLILLAGSAGVPAGVWSFRHFVHWGFANRCIAAVIPTFAFVLFVDIITAIGDAPSMVMSNIRLARSVALTFGYSLYYGPDTDQPIIGTLHTPLSHMLYVPFSMFRHPTQALLGGATLSFLLVFGPLMWVHFQTDQRNAIARLFSSYAFLACGLGLLSNESTSFVPFAINFSSVLTIAADALVILLFVVLLTPLQEKGWGRKVAVLFGRHAIHFSFIVAAASVVGSLFFSNVAGFVPCELCWIQRGFLYTLAVILLIGLIARREERRRAYDNFMRKCGLIISAIGFPIAAYNVYLQLGGGAIVPCSATGPSCSLVYFIRFGYVTIPTMSLTAFALVIAFMLFGEGMREE